MIAFPIMAAACAAEAGMKVPDDPNSFKSEEFPHFKVFCNVQLGASMPYATAHWDNAKVIAAISDDKILQITYEELLTLGLAVGLSK